MGYGPVTALLSKDQFRYINNHMYSVHLWSQLISIRQEEVIPNLLHEFAACLWYTVLVNVSFASEPDEKYWQAYGMKLSVLNPIE